MKLIINIGQLQYPPKKTKKQLDEEERKRQKEMRMKERQRNNFCTIEELLSGEYHRKRKAQLEKKEKIRAMRKKVELLKHEGRTDDAE